MILEILPFTSGRRTQAYKYTNNDGRSRRYTTSQQIRCYGLLGQLWLDAAVKYWRKRS
jgi:hypothetical protein